MKTNTSMYKNSYSVEKVHKMHLVCILEYCGMPINELPLKETKRLRGLAEALKDTNYEQFCEAWDYVVKRKKDPQSQQKVVPLDDASSILSSEVDTRMESVFAKIDTKFKGESKKLLDGVHDALADAIKIESQKYNVVQHTVKIGNNKPKKMKGILPPVFQEILQLAQEREEIMLVGPAGCGKTYMAEKLAEALDLSFGAQSMSVGVSEAAFTGRLLPLGKSAAFEYAISEFANKFENGGVFLIDEIDNADPNLLVFLNTALANGYFYNDKRPEKPRVERHPDFVCIACANTFGQGADTMYSSRNQLDAATLDRFSIGMTKVTYSPEVEQATVDPEILAWGLKVREAIDQHRMQKFISTRFLQKATKMSRNQNWDMEFIANKYFVTWTPEELAVLGVHSEQDKLAAFV